jgi:hypothetical protein
LGALSVLCCLGTHSIAGIASFLVLIPGSPLVASVASRAAYLSTHRTAWVLMWATWAMSSVALLGFYWVLMSRLEPPHPGLKRSVSLLMLLAIGVDISAQVVYATMTPGLGERFLAARGPERIPALAQFVWGERLPMLLSGAVANGLYSLCGVLVCVAAARDARFPRALRNAASLAWAGGLALSIASIAGDPGWIAVTTALAIGPFMLWCAAVGLVFFGRVPFPRREVA